MPYPTDDRSTMMGIGSYVGEIRRGPDGQVYQWVQGVDGLGNPVGFWNKLKKVAGKVVSKVTSAIPGVSQIKGAAQGFCNALPQIQPIVSLHPAIGPFAQFGTKICGTLKKVGLLGVDGEIMEAPDGRHYEVVEGIGEFGERQTMMRPVRLVISAHIQGRARRPTAAKPMPAQQPAMQSPQPAAPLQGFPPIRRMR
jgi:hypothetical protein